MRLLENRSYQKFHNHSSDGFHSSQSPRIYPLSGYRPSKSPKVKHDSFPRPRKAHCILASRIASIPKNFAELALTFKTLTSPPEGLFLRLDACSPKDGVRGISPLTNAEEILLRITTSHRATNSILRCLEKDEDIELFFLPFDETMKTDKEYRVFCAPRGGKIIVASQ
jgi:hypothetical protein